MTKKDTKTTADKFIQKLDCTPEQAIMLVMAMEFACESSEFKAQYGRFGVERLYELSQRIINL